MKKKRRCVIVLLLITILIGTISEAAGGKQTFKSRKVEKKGDGYWIDYDRKLPEITGPFWGCTDIPSFFRPATILGLVDAEVVIAVVEVDLVVILVLAGYLFYINIKKRTAMVISSLRKEVSDKSVCLEIANEEKDWLVKEIHHRVKNNLQVVMSLLNTQLSYLHNDEAIRAIRNSQHRMYSIALVHQKLYQADDLSSVDMAVYTSELLEHLEDAYDNSSRQIEFTIDMVPLQLDVAMAVPLGLILNEAVSNVFKYAFPNDVGGKVRISLHACDTAGSYHFEIADNGIGTASGNRRSADSFGRNLIAGLAKQMGGIYEIRDDNGVQIFIKFFINGEYGHDKTRTE